MMMANSKKFEVRNIKYNYYLYNLFFEFNTGLKEMQGLPGM